MRRSLKTKLRINRREIELHRDLGLAETKIRISYSGANASLSNTSSSRTHHRHIIHIVHTHQVYVHSVQGVLVDVVHIVQVHVHDVLVDVVHILRVTCVAYCHVSEDAVVAPERLVELEECHTRWPMDLGSILKIIPVPILLLCRPPLSRGIYDLLRGL